MNIKTGSLRMIPALAICLLIVGCPRDIDTQRSSRNHQAPEPKLFTRENWEKLVSDPETYTGARVNVVGKVFGAVERDETGTYWQMFVDPENSQFNVAVRYHDPEFDIHTDDYIRVRGDVAGEMEGKNPMGGTVTAPVVTAEEVELTTVLKALPTPEKTIDVHDSEVQHGVAITLEKIEIGVRETRVFLEISNKSEDKFSWYEHTAKLVQGETQFDTEHRSDYPEIQDELLPGVISSGVIVFEKIKPGEDVKLFVEGQSDNYQLDFEPYTFKVQRATAPGAS